MTDIDKCPFCNSAAELEEFYDITQGICGRDEGTYFYAVKCCECECIGPKVINCYVVRGKLDSFREEEGKEVAIKAWNSRGDSDVNRTIIQFLYPDYYSIRNSDMINTRRTRH